MKFTSSAALVLFGAALLLPACAPAADPTEEEGGEPAAAEGSDLLDIRGVGDPGWSNTHEKTPIAAEFGKALDRFDAISCVSVRSS
jgi:hypothetical protein